MKPSRFIYNLFWLVRKKFSQNFWYHMLSGWPPHPWGESKNFFIGETYVIRFVLKHWFRIYESFFIKLNLHRTTNGEHHIWMVVTWTGSSVKDKYRLKIHGHIGDYPLLYRLLKIDTFCKSAYFDTFCKSTPSGQNDTFCKSPKVRLFVNLHPSAGHTPCLGPRLPLGKLARCGCGIGFSA